MSQSKSGNRIPFEDIEGLRTWQPPSLGDGRIVPSVKRQDQDKQQQESIEDLGAVPVSPLTAKQLEEITAEAEKEARELGFQEGKAEGEKQGIALGEQRAYDETKALLLEKKSCFENLAEGLFNPITIQDERVENWLIELVVQFTKHLIQRELTQDPKVLFSLVKNVVSALPVGSAHIRIFVNVLDHAILEDIFKDKNWIFHIDQEMARGGCRVETDHSIADYSIETRIQRLLDDADFQEDQEPLKAPTDYAPSDESDEEDNDDEEAIP